MSRHAVRNKLLCAGLLLLSLFATDCKRIRLYDPEGGVFLELHVVSDFKEFDSCTGTMDDPVFKALAQGVIPTTAKVFVYDAVTHELVHEDILPAEGGGFIDIDAGTYDIIVYGMGAEHTRLTDPINRGLLKAYTEDDSDEGNPTGQTLIKQPDQLYSGHVEQLVVPTRPEVESFVRVKVDLEPLIQTYSFLALDISGLEHVDGVRCYITGQAPDRYLWDKHFTVHPVSLGLNAVKDEAHYSISCRFNTFGKIPEFSSKAILRVQVKGKSGTIFQWDYDVTDQFNNPDNTCHKLIVTDPIDIPDDSGDPVGFWPRVDPWKPHIIDIPVG